MKHNKHIHDEDYDFSIKLMVPLLSILVCTICLCATTWAWYTASVSTGVNSIKAGVGAQVSATIDNEPVDSESGPYTLNPHQTLRLTFSGSGAANGYYALIDITNGASEAESSSLLETMFSLAVNRVYALENDEKIRKAVYFGNGENPGSLTIENLDSTNTKIVSVNLVWAKQSLNEEGKHALDDMYISYPIEESGATIKLPAETRTTTLIAHFLNAETHENLPSDLSETSELGLNQEQTGLVEVYEFEGTSYEVYAPKGYLVVTTNENGEEIHVQSVVFENLYEGETNDVTVNCVPVEEENHKEEIVNTDEVINSVDETNDADTGQETNDSAYEEENVDDTNNVNISIPDSGESSDAIDVSDTETSDITEQSDSTGVSNADETVQSDINTEPSDDQPVESLIVTNSTDEVETENTPSSNDIDSGTEEFTE